MIEVEALSKSFGKVTALNGLRFCVEEGQLYGIVGASGAGKTTLMQILAGLLRGDSGTVYLDGIDVQKQRKSIRKLVSYMPAVFGVYDNLRVKEYMEFFANAYGFYGKNEKACIQEKLDMVGLLENSWQYVDRLSIEDKKKLCLARCLLPNPKVLLLDEPVLGLDEISKVEFKRILGQLSVEGKTLCLTTKSLTELKEVCTNIGILKDGKMFVSGGLQEVISQLNQANPLVVDCVAGQEFAMAYLKKNPKVETISVHGKKIYIGFSGNEMEEATLLQELQGEGTMISSFSRVDGDLEHLIAGFCNNASE